MPIGEITFNVVVNGRSVEMDALASNMTRVVQVERLRDAQAPGQGVIVRGSENAPSPGGLWRGVDWEAPQGALLTYIITGEDENDQSLDSSSVTLTEVVDYGGDYMMPVGRPELGTNVTVEYDGVGRFYREVSQDAVPVLQRPDPVVVSFGRKMWQGSMTFLTLEDEDKENFLILMLFPSLMFVSRPGFGFDEPVFFAPGTVSEGRTVGLGSESSRRMDVDMTQVQRPPTTYAADLPNTTWQEHIDTALTWQRAMDEFDNWYHLAGFRLAS